MALIENSQGKRIGIITNHTGVDRERRRNIDVMRQAGIQIAAPFSYTRRHLLDGQDGTRFCVYQSAFSIGEVL